MRVQPQPLKTEAKKIVTSVPTPVQSLPIVSLIGSPDYITINGNTIQRSLINLGAHVTGNLPMTHLGGGVGATSSTFLRGDGTWATPTGGVSDGDKGDITVTSSGTVWTIKNGVVDIANLSATGTPSASTYLRGDNTWASVSGSGASYYEVRKSTLYGS